jgi:prevent-host-death family protein
MKTFNIGDLRGRLSTLMKHVRDGEEVLVCDRNRPVAQIVPCYLEDRSEQERRLAARGVLMPPMKQRPPSVSWPQPPGKVSDKTMRRVLREERENR